MFRFFVLKLKVNHFNKQKYPMTMMILVMPVLGFNN